ncbi:S-layer homology domain-containing protein [Paenibacillus sp. JJ-223]|uniref:S-layer homology domain-containing protein n=1 Tax=Paenibacillus sp. JJ-223 TaxID=2905647 RepID=UPI001F481598|nr:S-layer homology domain-containing protein [Paenibacillus sp. JJ-223]CAH1204948.1 hypothetical protein PAECIP111890_02573 [Paenibacillus sp. JJ-223]
MNKKFSRKIVSASLATALLLPGITPTFASSFEIMNSNAETISTESLNSKSLFGDISGHWGQKAIEEWTGYGVVKGYNGKFRPNSPVTRAEFAAMIDNIMKYIEEGSNSFSDLESNKWYYGAILKLDKAGVLKGTNGEALAEKTITRQEAAVLLAGAFQTAAGTDSVTFKDSDQIADWAKASVQSLVSASVINGRPDGSFEPQANLSRAEAVTLFDHLIQMLVTTPGEYSQDVQGNIVVNTPDVILKDMTISGDLYVTQGVGEGEVTLDNVQIKGNVHIQGGGEHSIIFNNVDVQGALVVNKYNGKVRILATGSTSVSLTVLESGALVVTKDLTGGGFETVEIPADILAGQEIKLDGNFNKVVNHAANVQITASGSIKEFVAEAETNITGNVNIDKSSGNSSIVVNGAAYVPSAGTTGSSTGTGNSGNAGNAGNSGGSSTGGGNSGGSAPGNGNEYVAVTGLTVAPASASLVVGQKTQLTATVSPGNATNPRVNWKVADGQTSIISVSDSGLVTALTPGTGTVIATTEDGTFSFSSTITVSAPALGITLSKYEGSIVDPDTQLDEETKTNNEHVTILSSDQSLIQANHYDASITATQALQGTVTTSVYSVVSLTDADANPLVDVSGVKVTLDGMEYNPEFGVGLSQGNETNRFLLKLDIHQPRNIEQHQLIISREGYADTSMTITYRPEGTVVLQAIDPIAGELLVGSELSAGTVHYEGGPVNQEALYQWYHSDTETGLYSKIDGATFAKYTLTEDDGGKYIRIHVASDEIQASGSAISAAFGPVQTPVSAKEVFAEIEKVFLGKNTDKNNVISDLFLPTSLPGYPGVLISWSTDNESALSSTGVITRIEKEDQFVKLTATLSGGAAGTHEYDLTIRAAGTNNVGIDGFIDPYFVSSYPQAYIKDGTIHVKYALNAPAEVYMIVNVINGGWKSDVKAVLEGHSGENNKLIYTNQWPYFEITSDQINQVQDFDTGVRISDSNKSEAKVEFVIANQSQGYVSSEVTRIQFDQTVVGSLDTQPPVSYAKYINRDLDSIYVYFNEKLNTSSVPSIQDFTLSSGRVESLSVVNKQTGIQPAYVKLHVSGITEADLSTLRVSYNGTALKDLSDAENEVVSFSNAKINAYSPKFTNIMLSSDRRSVLVDIEPGWDPYDFPELNFDAASRARFSMQIASVSYNPNFIKYSYGSSEITYTLQFDSPLPEGEATLKFNSTGLIDWAQDSYPEEIISGPILQLPASGSPTASYSQQNGKIILSFANGFEISNSSTAAAGLTLKIDGVEYALRGYLMSLNWNSKNQIYIDLNEKYSWKFKQAVEQGSDIQIKYSKVNQEDQQQLSDAAGALIPDFDYIQVTKQ